jgi:release factor glutamine methyltransferase
VTVEEALREAETLLGDGGVATPRVDAEWIVGHVVGLRRAELPVARARPLGGHEREQMRELVARRAGREPLGYVLGEWGFRRLALKVDGRALVPRPETEALVSRCLELLRGVTEPEVLDVGTGSGAIAISIADEHPGARVTALDSSADALALARENLAASSLNGRVKLVEADLADALPAGPFDLVVSNPPYVPAVEIEELAPEVRDWEPRAAILDAGQTEAVAHAALGVLRAGAPLVLETHWDAASRVAALLAELGYSGVTITRDLGGIERVVEGRRP